MVSLLSCPSQAGQPINSSQTLPLRGAFPALNVAIEGLGRAFAFKGDASLIYGGRTHVRRTERSHPKCTELSGAMPECYRVEKSVLKHSLPLQKGDILK